MLRKRSGSDSREKEIQDILQKIEENPFLNSRSPENALLLFLTNEQLLRKKELEQQKELEPTQKKELELLQKKELELLKKKELVDHAKKGLITFFKHILELINQTNNKKSKKNLNQKQFDEKIAAIEAAFNSIPVSIHKDVEDYFIDIAQTKMLTHLELLNSKTENNYDIQNAIITLDLADRVDPTKIKLEVFQPTSLLLRTTSSISSQSPKPYSELVKGTYRYSGEKLGSGNFGTVLKYIVKEGEGNNIKEVEYAFKIINERRTTRTVQKRNKLMTPEADICFALLKSEGPVKNT